MLTSRFIRGLYGHVLTVLMVSQSFWLVKFRLKSFYHADFTNRDVSLLMESATFQTMVLTEGIKYKCRRSDTDNAHWELHDWVSIQCPRQWNNNYGQFTADLMVGEFQCIMGDIHRTLFVLLPLVCKSF